MSEQELRHLVWEAVGAASMQWEPRPTGVFDSTGALGVADRLLAALIPHFQGDSQPLPPASK